MKFITFIAARGEAEAFGKWILKSFAPGFASQSAGCSVNLVASGETRSEWDVILEIWSDSADILLLLDAPEIRQKLRRIASYRVLEAIEKDDGVQRARPTPGIKLVAAWIGRDDVAREDLRRHWDEHVPLANRIHIGVRRYVRNWVTALASAPTPFPPPYQGFAFQYFDSQADLIERSFDRPESVQIIADDVADFISSHEVLLTTEYLFKAP